MRRRGGRTILRELDALCMALSVPVRPDGEPMLPAGLSEVERTDFASRWRADGRRLLDADPALYGPLVSLFGWPA